MALVVKDRVRETTTTTGTGTVTLAGAVAGFQSFSVIGNGNTTYYTITNNVDWEVGIGTYTSSGTTLSRDTILESSNGGAAVNFGAGTKDVFVTYPAEKSISDGYGLLPVANGGTGATSLTSGYLVKGNGTSAVSASVVYDNGTNVGIGTSSPSYKLDVAGAVSIDNGGAIVGKNTTGGDAQLLYWSATSGVSIYGRNTLGGSVTQHEFRTAGATRLTIDNSGNVGIGTSSPSYTLDVSGAGQIGIRYTDTVATNSARLYLTCGTATGALQQYGSSHATFANVLRLDSFAGPLQFATLNVERMRIDSSGNVGIATTSPSYKLDVAGTLGVGDHITLTRAGGQFITKNVSTSYVLYSGGTSLVGASIIMGGGTDATYGGDMLFRAGTTNSPERMRVTSSGNVGIGTSSPSGKLDVSNGGTTALFGADSGADTRTDATSKLARIGVPHYTNAEEPVAMFVPVTGSATNQLQIGGGTGSFNAMNLIQFYTAANNTTLTGTERMRIDSSGNVGIGTTSPSQKLHVNSGRGQISISSSGATASAQGNALFVEAGFDTGITIGTPNTGVGALYFADADHSTIGFVRYSHASNAIALGTNATERLRIDSSGNVGIGTSSPSALLDVQGSGSVYARARSLDTTGAAIGYVGAEFAGGSALQMRAGLGYTYLVSTGASDPLLFGTNTTERMRVTSAGDVGIGTSSPTSRLTITGGVTEIRDGNYFMLRPAGNGWDMRLQATGTQLDILSGGALGSPIMSLVNGGNVGIGTSSPGVKLDVAGGSIRVGNTHSMQFRNAAGTAVAYMTLQSDDNFVTYNAAGAPISSFTQGATNNAVYGSNANNRMVVDSINNVTSWTVNGSERMRIDSSGNVGIGNTGPGYRLDVTAGDTTAGLGYAMRLRSNATAAAATLQFTNNGVTAQNGLIACTDTGLLTVQGDGASSAIAFRTAGSERFRIDSAGGITSSDLADAVGYKGLPQNAKTAAYTLALSDMGKHISITTGGITVPANASVAFPIGATIVIFNNSASSQNIAITTDTMYLAGTATTGTRTLAQRGLATVVKVASTTWVISGSGVT